VLPAALRLTAGAQAAGLLPAVVLHAATREDLALIVGRAGAGKTTAAATVATAYREAGYEVRGGAPPPTSSRRLRGRTEWMLLTTVCYTAFTAVAIVRQSGGA
jgi:hypothetical protein